MLLKFVLLLILILLFLVLLIDLDTLIFFSGTGFSNSDVIFFGIFSFIISSNSISLNSSKLILYLFINSFIFLESVNFINFSASHFKGPLKFLCFLTYFFNLSINFSVCSSLISITDLK